MSATITASMIKELRQKTGAGMMDCKKALVEANGEMDKAVEILRKKGIASAAKKSSRTTSEGVISTYITEDLHTGSIIELNCETDFVAKNEQFLSLASQLAKIVALNKIDTVSDLYEYKLEDGTSVQDLIKTNIARIGENIKVKRISYFSSNESYLFSYVHFGGKSGVLLEINTKGVISDEIKNLGKDLCMQITALKPYYISNEDIPEEILNKEKEIYEDLAKKEGKPEKVIPRIVEGRLQKFYSNVCLLHQPFIKEDKIKIKDYIKQVEKKVNTSIEIVRFILMQVGQDI